MYQKIIQIICLTFMLTSCETDREYKFVLINEEKSLLGGSDIVEKEGDVIRAKDDSSAYLEAYQTFCIYIKTNRDIKQAFGTAQITPVKFKLINDKGEDIANTVFFINKDEKEKEIMARTLSMSNNIKETVDKIRDEEKDKVKASLSIDSVKVQELSKYFRQKKDEFSNNNKIWYEPKTAPQYTNRNGLYCYFQTENEVPSNIRLRFQYYSEEWLFFHKIQFAIDGKAYEFVPFKTERDSGDGGKIWEWCDQTLSQEEKELIYALANAKSAKMKIIGRQYYDEKTISKEQIRSIKQTLDLYNALGGKF